MMPVEFRGRQCQVERGDPRVQLGRDRVAELDREGGITDRKKATIVRRSR